MPHQVLTNGEGGASGASPGLLSGRRGVHSSAWGHALQVIRVQQRLADTLLTIV